MIQLIYKEFNPQIEFWKKKLDEIVIKHELVESSETQESVLLDGKERFIGEKAIEEHLIYLESYLKEWRNCRCDKWFDTGDL